MKDNVLLLGGGFIGQALAKHLVGNGKSVTIISRSAPEHLPKNIDWQQGDLDDQELIRRNLEKCEIVVHLASTSTPGCNIYTPSREAEENLLPLLRLLEVMHNQTDAPLLFLSSGGSVYGHPTTCPVSETHPLAPLSNHAAGKAAAEHFLEVFAHQGHPVTILRPSNVYGPEQPLKAGFGIVRTLLEHLKSGTEITIWGDGETVRDYLYIDDFVCACIAILETPSLGTFNIGSGLGYSINDLCLLCEQITGKALNLQYQPIRNIDVQRVVLDNAEISNRYGWQPAVSLEQGIRLTWEWLKNTP